MDLFKSKLPINKLLYVVLRNFKNISSENDLIQLLPQNCLKDITDAEQIKSMDDRTWAGFKAKYDTFYNKFYTFKESKKVHGELDIAFIEESLVNMRIQLFFQNAKNKYNMNNIKIFIEELLTINWDNNDSPYLSAKIYPYLGKAEKKLVVGIRKPEKSISISITDGRYF